MEEEMRRWRIPSLLGWADQASLRRRWKRRRRGFTGAVTVPFRNMEASCSTNSVCEDIDCESSLPSFNCKESNTEDQQSVSMNIKDTVEIEIHEDSNYCSESKEDSFIDEVHGAPAHGAHLQDFHAEFSASDAASDENNEANSGENSAYMEPSSSGTFDGSLEKFLSKSATFPSSELELYHSFCAEETAASPTYKRSVSLPPSSNFVSAMKGGRARHGIDLSSDLRVKWAADVYDPPASSMLQMVKINDRLQRKSKKKDKQRHKHAKGKTSRVRSCEKKYS